jgi:hypothetical protein
MGSTYLVRKGQGQLDLVGDGLGVSTALNGSAEEGGAGPQGRASEAEGAHCAMDGDVKAGGSLLKVALQRSKSGAGCSLVARVTW